MNNALRLLSGIGFFLLAGPAFDLLGFDKLGAALQSPAHAVIGRPATPVSFAGEARRTARRVDTAAVVTAAVVTTAAVATTAAVVASSRAMAVGTVVTVLPGGCVQAGGSFSCGGVYYRPSYQGPNLVYVVVTGP